MMLALTITISIIPSAYAQSNNEISIVSDTSTLADKAYDPNPLTINQDDTVTWTNKDFGIHTVTENQELFGSEDLRPDQTFDHTFDSSGTYYYHCKLHPTMTGKIFVN
ncbi:MAG: cupredoxin domain-containing protein [Candidatus Nitrosocosmicus sp.]|nr:cupredoxin domain-containing protein [Candidatus Nitrosocosmicus sp.]MDN5868566.1 cupredoxin domain-containing protein [Candidatus Nitrosocosmicus sp.]